jgi:RNA polymerase sigma-70 factor, ECF subfamily
MADTESHQLQFKRELLKTLPSLRAFAISLTGT